MLVFWLCGAGRSSVSVISRVGESDVCVRWVWPFQANVAAREVLEQVVVQYCSPTSLARDVIRHTPTRNSDT
jgi:hypothetical protein